MIESPLLDRVLAQQVRQTRQSVILEMLEGRFGSVPDDLAEQLRAVDSESQFKDLARFAGTCPDLKALRLHLTTVR